MLTPWFCFAVNRCSKSTQGFSVNGFKSQSLRRVAELTMETTADLFLNCWWKGACYLVHLHTDGYQHILEKQVHNICTFSIFVATLDLAVFPNRLLLLLLSRGVCGCRRVQDLSVMEWLQVSQFHSIHLVNAKHDFCWNLAFARKIILSLVFGGGTGGALIFCLLDTLVDGIKFKSLGPFQFWLLIQSIKEV